MTNSLNSAPKYSLGKVENLDVISGFYTDAQQCRAVGFYRGKLGKYDGKRFTPLTLKQAHSTLARHLRANHRAIAKDLFSEDFLEWSSEAAEKFYRMTAAAIR
jgi:hypothetical protein